MVKDGLQPTQLLLILWLHNKDLMLLLFSHSTTRNVYGSGIAIPVKARHRQVDIIKQSRNAVHPEFSHITQHKLYLSWLRCAKPTGTDYHTDNE